MQRHGDGDRTKLLVHIRRAPQPSLPRDQISELLDKFGVVSARRLRKFVAGNGFRFGKRVAWRGTARAAAWRAMSAATADSVCSVMCSSSDCGCSLRGLFLGHLFDD